MLPPSVCEFLRGFLFQLVPSLMEPHSSAVSMWGLFIARLNKVCVCFMLCWSQIRSDDTDSCSSRCLSAARGCRTRARTLKLIQPGEDVPECREEFWKHPSFKDSDLTNHSQQMIYQKQIHHVKFHVCQILEKKYPLVFNRVCTGSVQNEVRDCAPCFMVVFVC